MKNIKDYEAIVKNIESEMVAMWHTGEAPDVLKNDPDFIKLIILAVYHDKIHFQQLGMVVGEA